VSGEYLLRQSHHLNQIVQGYKSKLRMHDPAAAWIAFSDEDKDGEDEWEEEEQEEEEEEEEEVEAGSGYSYDA
jgi:ribosomal protein L12E/L44/L45/RPP1/RPP2